MHMFVILLLLFGCYSTLTNSRPSHLQEEKDSEIGGSDYESDETVDDEYVPEESQAAEDEVVQKDSENQELIDARRFSDKNFNNNGEAFEKFTEMRNKKIEEENNPNDVRFQAERFSFAKEHPNYIFGSNNVAESGGLQSSRNDYPRHRAECRNSEHLANDNSGDILFKRFHDHMKKDISDNIEDANEQSNLKKQYDRTLENRAAKDYDYVYSSDRNRRQVQNVEEKPVTVLNNIKKENNNLDVVNESAILRNIKKLSEQDLEELMNSLPDDKKELLKKIMDKREITKKAGAMEDSNCLDQSDTSKIEGSYSVNTNSVSSLFSNSDATETNKNIESGGGLNTKVSDNEGESGKSESKSGDAADTSTTKELLEITDTSSKDVSNINSENGDSFKSENKREINRNYLTNENTPLDKSIISDNKNLNDLPVQEENSENEDWLETKNEDLIAEQEVSQVDSSDLTAAVEKLEESFPNANADGDTDSYLEPLIRIKRKELQHKVKKRDLPFLANEKVSVISDSESNRSDEEDGNEFNYKESLNSQPDFLKNVIDHNIPSNKKIRKKRDLNSDDIFNTTFNNTLKLNKCNHNIMASLYNEDNLAPNFSTDKSQYKGDETGSLSQNSDDNLSRHKRIRRVKNSNIIEV